MNNADDILYSPVENHNEPEKPESETGFSTKFWEAIVDQVTHEVFTITMTTTAAASTPINIQWNCDDLSMWVRC